MVSISAIKQNVSTTICYTSKVVTNQSQLQKVISASLNLVAIFEQFGKKAPTTLLTGLNAVSDFLDFASFYNSVHWVVSGKARQDFSADKTKFVVGAAGLLADGATHLSFWQSYKFVDLTKVATKLGNIQIRGIHVFAIVNKISLETFAISMAVVIYGIKTVQSIRVLTVNYSNKQAWMDVGANVIEVTTKVAFLAGIGTGTSFSVVVFMNFAKFTAKSLQIGSFLYDQANKEAKAAQ